MSRGGNNNRQKKIPKCVSTTGENEKNKTKKRVYRTCTSTPLLLGFILHFLVQMSRKMCHHDRSIISSPPSRSLSHLYGVHYPIHIIRVLKKKPGHYYLIIILPLSLSLYSIYLSGPFLFFGVVALFRVVSLLFCTTFSLYSAFNFCANDP